MEKDIKNNSLNNERKEVPIHMDNVIQAYEVFKNLSSVNVNEFIKEKQNLKYLTWAHAWKEVKKKYPLSNFEVRTFNGLPYVYDEKTGYMCFTRVTIQGLTHEMHLPVLDYANRAMKSTPYEVKTSYGKKTVEAATMFDINNTIMRCLTKNLAMFGLGLYLYLGEDLPEVDAPADNVPVSANVRMPNLVSQSTTTNPVPVNATVPNPVQHPTQQKQATPKSNWVVTKTFD